MPTHDDATPEFLPDLSPIAFPSDDVTLGQIRKQQPELLFSNDELVANWRRPFDIEAIAMARLEHLLARKAFAKESGIEDPHPQIHRREAIRQLSLHYKDFSLANGEAQTALLVGKFEEQAEQLARDPGRKTGPGR